MNTATSPRYLVAEEVYSNQVAYATLGANYLADNAGNELVVYAEGHYKLDAIAQAKEGHAGIVSVWRRKGNALSSLYELVRPAYPLSDSEHPPRPDYTNLAIKSERTRLEEALRDAQAKLDALAHLLLGDA